MCTTVGFDASFDSELSFLMNLLPKIVKTKYAPLRHLDAFKEIFILLYELKKVKAFVMPTGLLGSAVASFWGYVRL